MKVEVFACPDDQQDISDEDYPAGGDSEDVVSEDSDSGDSEIWEVVVQGEVVDCESLKGACEDDDSDGLPFCGDECEGKRKKSADRVVHEIPP